jgi:hypothetical protein
MNRILSFGLGAVAATCILQPVYAGPPGGIVGVTGVHYSGGSSVRFSGPVILHTNPMIHANAGTGSAPNGSPASPRYSSASGSNANPSAGSKPLVTTVQNQLTRLGYVTGAADGLNGPLTRNAVSSFQRDHHLSVTGQIDQTTLRVLGVPQQ